MQVMFKLFWLNYTSFIMFPTSGVRCAFARDSLALTYWRTYRCEHRPSIFRKEVGKGWDVSEEHDRVVFSTQAVARRVFWLLGRALATANWRASARERPHVPCTHALHDTRCTRLSRRVLYTLHRRLARGPPPSNGPGGRYDLRN